MEDHPDNIDRGINLSQHEFPDLAMTRGKIIQVNIQPGSDK